MKKVLLIVDVQNDFCPGGALAVPRGDEVVEPLNKMIDYAEKNGWLVVASRDWHPPVTKHFKIYGGIWPVHCVLNTEGARFHPRLKLSNAVVVSKAMKPDEDGYSAFDGRTDSGWKLTAFLGVYGGSEIYVGGLATDYCVKASALDAVKNGFKTYLLTDACRAVNLNPDDGQKAIDEMVAAGVVLISTDEVVSGKIAT